MRRWTSCLHLILCIVMVIVLVMAFFACGNNNNTSNTKGDEVLTEEVIGNTLKPYYQDFLEKSGHSKEFINEYFSYNYFDDYTKEAYNFITGLGLTKEEFVTAETAFKPFWNNVVSYYISDKNYRAKEITSENISLGLKFFNKLISLINLDRVGNVLDKLYTIENNFDLTDKELKDIFRHEDCMDLYNEWYGAGNPFHEFARNIYNNKHVKTVITGVVAGIRNVLDNNYVEEIKENILIIRQILKIKNKNDIIDIVFDNEGALTTSEDVVKVINFFGSVINQYLVGAEQIPGYTKSIEVVANMLLNRLNYTLNVENVGDLAHFAANVLMNASAREIRSIAIDIIHLFINEGDNVSQSALYGTIIVKAFRIVQDEYLKVSPTAKQFLIDLIGFSGSIEQFNKFVIKCNDANLNKLTSKDYEQYFAEFMALVETDIVNRPDTIDDLIFVSKNADIDAVYQEIMKTNASVKNIKGDYYKFSSLLDKSCLTYSAENEGYGTVLFTVPDDVVSELSLKKYYNIPVYYYDETTKLGLSFRPKLITKNPLVLDPFASKEDLIKSIENEMRKLQVVNCKTLLAYNPQATNYEYDILGEINTAPGLHIGVVQLHHPVFEGKKIPFIYYVKTRALNGGIDKKLTKIKVFDNKPYIVGQSKFNGTVIGYYDYIHKNTGNNTVTLNENQYTMEGFDTSTPGIKYVKIIAENGVSTDVEITVITQDIYTVGRDYKMISMDITEHKFNSILDSSGKPILYEDEPVYDIPLDISPRDFIKDVKGIIYFENIVFGYAVQFSRIKDIHQIGLSYTMEIKFVERVGDYDIYDFVLKLIYDGKVREKEHTFYTGVLNKGQE